MNDFLYQERLTKEYRRNMIAVAKKQSQHSSPRPKKTSSGIFKALLKLSATLR
ncbi:MAG: hypothetical protein HN390_03005 [Anaerolineae bacterium]|jgi:hypothetical protein|nr:hypothetical protein [Anaerolineae bacterium]MBT7190282.1 hypothetical protein [Anaerolineae bacterium]MBT7990222.1 hypothetical protein [Anaerolineae bacterium]